MLDIVPNCNLVQYQGNIMMQPWENGKNSNFGPNLVPPKIFFIGFTSTSSWAMFQAIILFNFLENEWTKLEKMTKKLDFGPHFSPFDHIWALHFFSFYFILFYFFLRALPPLVTRHCSKLSNNAIKRKTNEPNLRK